MPHKKALCGAIAGNMIEISQQEPERDYRRYRETPGFAELSRFCEAINQQDDRS